jgi:predicted  nucleic acid-binding Zn-ribbon protein
MSAAIALFDGDATVWPWYSLPTSGALLGFSFACLLTQRDKKNRHAILHVKKRDTSMFSREERNQSQMSSEEMLMQIEHALTEAEEQKALLMVELQRVNEARKELEQDPDQQIGDALKKLMAHQPEIEAQLQRVNEQIASLQERRTALIVEPSV